MARPIYPRMPPILMSDHAFGRWLLRGQGRKPKSKKGLATLIGTLLYARLRSGSGVPTRGLAIELDLGGPLRAVLRLGEFGWVCTTVRDVDEPWPGEERAG